MKQILKLLCSGSLMIVTANSYAIVVTPSINYIDYACAHINLTGLPEGWAEARAFEEREKARASNQQKDINIFKKGAQALSRLDDCSKLHDQTLMWVNAEKPLALPMRQLLAELAQEETTLGGQDPYNFKNVITKSDKNARTSAWPVKVVLVSAGALWVLYHIVKKKVTHKKHILREIAE